MPPKGMTKTEKAQWLRLYDKADRLNQLNPWQWMGVADCFGVIMPRFDEPCFVVFGGEEKTFRNVRFLLGWKAFYELVTRLADPAKQGPAWLLEIRMIELLYVNRTLLFEHEAAFLDTIDRVADETCATPVFRSIRPGYHPWLPEAQERDLLEAVLYQAFGMALRVEADAALLRERFPREILIRSQDANGAWQDLWSPVKEIGDEEVEVRIESKRMQAVCDRPLQEITMQLDLVFTPLKILPDGQRPQTAYVLLAVDAKNGFILSAELLQATEGVAKMWAQIPDRLLAVFERLGGCPEKIEIRGDRMANLLRPLGEFLPFKMVRREKLALIEEAHEKLSMTLMRQGEDGPLFSA